MSESQPREVRYQPRAYLDEYFLQLNEEYEGLYRFWSSAVAAQPGRLRALELGVGPAIYSALPLAERFAEIHLADYVKESLHEIERWLRQEPGCFDWRLHTQLVLRLEGREGSAPEVSAREARLREAVRWLGFCDLRAQNPLAREGQLYDLVTAHYCTEAASSSVAEWRGLLQNISRLIRPGGRLLLSVASRLDLYRLYREDTPARPSPLIDLEEAAAGLREAGLVCLSQELLPAPAGRPYVGTVLILAERPAPRAEEAPFAELFTRADDQRGLRSLRAFGPGEALCSFASAAVTPRPNRLTVQSGERTHLLPTPALLQRVNHSCEPNVSFDVERFALVSLRRIEPGEELRFFYPSTEWELSEPFLCRCGGARCVGEVRGAAALPAERLEPYALAPHIQRKLARR